MELKELRSLVALADLGSITMVAEKLHLSPAAVHKQLKVLEGELGVRLYEKVGRGLILTQASDVMIPYVRDLLAQYDSALSALEEWKGMKRGVVRIGAGPTISSYVLPVLLRKFRHGWPQVELFIETGNTPVLLDALRDGSLDLALIVSSDLVEASEFNLEARWDFEMVLVSHQHRFAGSCRVAELAKLPFILFPKGSRMEEPIDRYFASHDFRPKVIMRFDNAEAIKAMIRTGLGISVLPLWIVDADIRQGRLHLIHQKEPPVRSRLALISRKSRYVPRAAQAFVDVARRVEWKSPRLVHQSATVRPE